MSWKVFSSSGKYDFKSYKKNMKKSFLNLGLTVISLNVALGAPRLHLREGSFHYEPRHFARNFTDIILSVSELT